MMQRNCWTENRRAKTTSRPPYRVPVCQSQNRAALERSDYAARPFQKYSAAEFWATLGFPLEIEVLPTRPVQTASAAIPLPPRRRIEPAMPDPKPETIKSQPVLGEQETNPSPHFLGGYGQENQSGQANLRAEPSDRDRSPRPSFICKKRKKRHPLPLQSGLFAGIFTSIVAFTLGLFWWLDNPDSVRLTRTALLPSIQAPPSAGSAGERSSTNPVLKARVQEEPVTAAGTPVDSSTKEIASKNNEVQSEQSLSIQPSEARSRQTDDNRIVPVGTSHRKAGAATSTTRTKQVKGKQNRNTSRRTASASGRERTNEISRLRAQAFSETKKDRIGTINSTQKRHLPALSKSDRPSARKTSMAAEFSQCNRKASFFEREKCKWRLCAGKWGKNGCPSYNHDVARY